MSRVFVVNMGGHNHHLAEPYGELVAVTSGYVSPGSLDRVLYDIVKGISTSTPNDWLLLSGLMILNSLSSACWLQKHGTLKLLLWDNKHREYRPFQTDTLHVLNLWEQINGEKAGPSSP